MFVRDLKDCREFEAGDGSLLRELLNARKGNFVFNYSLAHATIKKGQKTKLHRLAFSEVYYILEGRGIMHIDEGEFEVCPGSTIYIPPHSKQCIENAGGSDLKF